MADARRFEEAIERTTARFVSATGHRSVHYYVGSKLRSDPAVRAIAELGDLGEVLDIGCGRGQLALFLLEAGLARRVHAFDRDERKIAFARRAAEGLAASFEASDICTAPAASADTVLLVDVLHYMSVESQDELIRAAAACLRPGGRLVVREATTSLGWRSAVTLAAESVAKLVRLNLGERIAIRDVHREIVPALEAMDLACTVEPCWRGTPFANVLLVARRAA
jgi:2-polyprenyl-3-methyl-5-hydroxy-6-metoxy-1,4-benzoquinol methylase